MLGFGAAATLWPLGSVSQTLHQQELKLRIFFSHHSIYCCCHSSYKCDCFSCYYTPPLLTPCLFQNCGSQVLQFILLTVYFVFQVMPYACLIPTKAFPGLWSHTSSDFTPPHLTPFPLAAIIVIPRVLYAQCLIKINWTSALFTVFYAWGKVTHLFEERGVEEAPAPGQNTSNLRDYTLLKGRENKMFLQAVFWTFGDQNWFVCISLQFVSLYEIQ